MPTTPLFKTLKFDMKGLVRQSQKNPSYIINLKVSDLSRGWQIFFDTRNKQVLISEILNHGFETTYEFSSQRDKKFLLKIKSIATNRWLLEEKINELELELPNTSLLPNI